MQVERHVELGDRAPERPVLRQVVVERAVGLAGLREAVHQRADKAELLDAARQLTRRLIRVLHRQRGEIREAVRPLRDLGGEMSFASRATAIARFTSWIACTAGALSERIMISTPDASISRSRLSWKSVSRGPSSSHTCAPNTLRVGQRRRDGEMLFERDLALHVWSPCGAR